MARSIVVDEVVEGSEVFVAVLALADRVLGQRRYITSASPHASESVVLGAFSAGACLGFLRYLVQVVGTAEERPPVNRNGAALTEGFVEAFGVEPTTRRQGIGSALQAAAEERCRESGCYQMRSRSPVSSTENYALKIERGYVVSPSESNDSYFFALRL